MSRWYFSLVRCLQGLQIHQLIAPNVSIQLLYQNEFVTVLEDPGEITRDVQ